MSMMTVGLTFAVVASATAAVWFFGRGNGRTAAAYGTSCVALVVAATLSWRISVTADDEVNVVARGLSAGYMTFDETSSPVAAPSATVSRRQALPSVPAMIARLEDRLVDEPDDAKGWSLLAQSYAYVGNGNGVERAITNAVRLGVEESRLRSQVANVQNERR